jgi:hypothetical protein
MANRLFFAPLPELFADPASLAAAWRACGQPPHATDSVVHLRFGSIRTARLLKGARNGAVVAESHGAGPMTTSAHPFASGLVLPAEMRRVFVYRRDNTHPSTTGGAPPPVTQLPRDFLDADLNRARDAKNWGAWEAADGSADGIDIVPFADFRAGAGTGPQAGHRRGQLVRRALRQAGTDKVPFVLLPWNMDHPGSIVPDLLARLSRLQGPDTPRLRLLVMAFNYLGQTGIIKRLVARVREAAEGSEQLLADVFLARISQLSALPALLRLTRLAWVDGNDPEHGWTLSRLRAAGITPILLEPPGRLAPPPGKLARLEADDPIWLEAETRYGTLNFPAHLPSQRALPTLLARTMALSQATAKRRRTAPHG